MQIVFKTLKFIKHGNIKLTNHDNKIYNFGSPHEELKVTINKFKKHFIEYFVSMNQQKYLYSFFKSSKKF